MPDDELAVLRSAPLYQTAPVGPPGQPEYYNTVVEVETTKSPEDLLRHLKTLEVRLGRTENIRWGPRLIDLDLLLYDSEVRSGPGLVVPHPEMHRRGFVLVPLADLVPELIVPRLGRSVRALLEGLELDPHEVVRLGDAREGP